MEVVKERWIIDTDPGCDDMMAILYLLNQPNVEVEFISLAEGNCKMKDVERNIKKIMAIYGKEVQVYKGCEYQLYHGAANAYEYHYSDGLGGLEEIEKVDISDIKLNYSEKSPTKIVKTVNKYPGQINLLCLAPTTNIAVAYMLDPSISTKFKDIVIMGGSYDFNGNVIATSEFNFYHDFIATSIFFQKFKNILVIGWEPTKKVQYTINNLIESKNIAINMFGGYNDKLYFYLELIIKKYSKEMKGVEICDLYTVIAYFYPLSVEEYTIAKQSVVIDSDTTKGAFLRSDVQQVDIKYDSIINDYFKKGKEYKKGYNIYVEQMSTKAIVEQFSYILKPVSFTK